MNLDQLFTLEGADKSTNGHGYAETYERLFSSLRLDTFTLIEIGVYQGASIRAWLQFFPNAHIVGIDCLKQWATSDPRFTFFEGAQQDDAFLDRVLAVMNNIGIVIDDGSHRPVDQWESFKAIWPRLAHGGFYIIEDVQCWADAEQDPAYRNFGSDFLFDLFRKINLYGKEYIGRPGPPVEVSPSLREYDSIYLTKGLLIIKKK